MHSWDVRRVEAEGVCEFQRGPSHLRGGEITGFHSVYVDCVMSRCFPSPREEMDLNCARKDFGQIVRRTSWPCELIKGRSCQPQTHTAAGKAFCFPAKCKGSPVSEQRHVYPAWKYVLSRARISEAHCFLLPAKQPWLCHFGSSQACRNRGSCLGCLFLAIGQEESIPAFKHCYLENGLNLLLLGCS